MVYCKKKVSDFPVPSRDVTNQTVPGGDSDIPAGDGKKIYNLFLQCILTAVLFQCILILW